MVKPKTRGKLGKAGYLWDALVWLLVAFPLLTGGVWLRKPHLFLELSELGAPVLFVGVLGALLKWAAGRPLERASSIRAASWAWGKWSGWLARMPKRAIWAAALLAGAIWSLSSIRRHWAFGSGAADLGIFTNAIWNLSHGHGYVSSLKDGLNLFADHQSPIFWALAPLYRLFPKAETLLVAQAAWLATGGIAAYFIACQYLPKGHWGRALVPLLYWINIPIRNANAFDFHPETLMLPLFLFAIAGLQSTSDARKKWGALAFILALLCKESAGPVAAGVGLAWYLGAGPEKTRPFTRVAGVLALILGIVAFAIDVKVVPSALGVKYAYEANYSQFGKSLGWILLSPITRPTLFLQHLFGKARLEFLFGTLAPLAFLPLLSPRALVAALPGYLILFLSNGDYRIRLIYHYAIEPSVGLFWALPGAIALVSERRPAFLRAFPVAAWIAFWAIGMSGRAEMFGIRIHEPTEHQTWLRRELLPRIASPTVAASGALVPHLANRPWIHHLPRLDIPPEKTNVICVVEDTSVNQWPMTTEQIPALHKRLSDLKYQVLYQCGPLTVYQSPLHKDSCLSSTPFCPPPG